jgi:hypothetical protein
MVQVRCRGEQRRSKRMRPIVTEVMQPGTYSVDTKLEPHTLLRYEFRPASIDQTRAGTLDTNNNKLSIKTKTGEDAEFNGKITQPKSTECLLVWEPNTQSFQLQRVQQFALMRYARKQASAAPPVVVHKTPKVAAANTEEDILLSSDLESD